MKHGRVIKNIDNRNDKHGDVVCLDEPGPGNACHIYKVLSDQNDVFADVKFQKGPVQEVDGWNGCQNEDLLLIVRDRLQGFQSGSHSDQFNAMALARLEEALMWLNARTADRERRNVEGTSEK